MSCAVSGVKIKNRGQNQEILDGRYPHRNLEFGSSIRAGTCSCQEPCFGSIDRMAAQCSQCEGGLSIGLENKAKAVVHAQDPWTPAPSSLRAILGPGYRNLFGSYPIPTQPYTEFLLQNCMFFL